jgi:fumarylacetoacetase
VTAGESWIPIPEGSGFGLDNLPLGIGARAGERARAHVAIGDHALDLARVADAGLLDEAPPALVNLWYLNALLAGGRGSVERLRRRVADLVTDATVRDRLADAVVRRDDLAMSTPVRVHDYVDFYSSLHHATNLGRILRPGTEPLPAAWRHLPIGYHGRAGTIVATGATVPRPSGLRLVAGNPEAGPTAQLDIELEVGFVIGLPNERGAPVAVDDAADHIAGFCLVNDWSARDIQAFEYQPLGPFLGKSFATSMSPWLVTLDALEPYFAVPPVQSPAPAGYLQAREPWGLDLRLEIALSSAAMRADGIDDVVVSRTTFADMYWTPAQQLAHATVNGASTEPGDLFASGTVSGATPGSEGSFIELTHRGEHLLELPDGTSRSFLEDGDRVTLRGWAGGGARPVVSLGEVVGTVTPSRARREGGS